MGAGDRPDNQIEGQVNIETWYGLPERLFAVSRIFAKAKKYMSLAEQKTFVYALSELRFTEEATSDSEVVYMDKKTLASIVGINTDEDHLSVDLYARIKELPKHSYIEVSQEDKGIYDSGVLITRVTMLKNRVRVRFEKEYLPLFTGLSTNYITMWSSDIFKMSSVRTVRFYEHLRELTDTRLETNDVLLGVKALKELFDIPKDGEGSYMRKDGHFDRPAFEKYVIEPLCQDMKNCKMISLLPQPDGKYYVKEKQGGRVTGYRFYWTFSAYPSVATAEEVKQIQERIDKDPRVLKVAKDILKGEKKPKKAKSGFNGFDQRNEDIDETWEKLLKKTQERYKTQ